MDLSPSPDQRLLDEVARAFVARACPLDRVRALDAPGADPLDRDLWRSIGELGWPGLLVPEEHGGAGAGMAAMVVVCEALGLAAVPTPLVASAVGAVVTLAAGDADQRARWLPRLAAGEAIGTLAVLEPGAADEWSPPALAGGPGLTGAKLLVPWAGVADVVVVATADGLHLVEPSAGGLNTERHTALGGDPIWSVRFDGAPAEQVGGAGGRPAADWARVADHVAVAHLAHAVGLAEAALELTLTHARDRHQFGRPIGSFQAVAHRCVDMRADLDACRLLVHQAAWALDRDGPDALPVAAALAYAKPAVRRIFQHAHQVHGAMGFSTEHPLHLFTKRAKAFELTWGTTARHQERLAAAMGLEGP